MKFEIESVQDGKGEWWLKLTVTANGAVIYQDYETPPTGETLATNSIKILLDRYDSNMGIAESTNRTIEYVTTFSTNSTITNHDLSNA